MRTRRGEWHPRGSLAERGELLADDLIGLERAGFAIRVDEALSKDAHGLLPGVSERPEPIVFGDEDAVVARGQRWNTPVRHIFRRAEAMRIELVRIVLPVQGQDGFIFGNALF